MYRSGLALLSFQIRLGISKVDVTGSQAMDAVLSSLDKEKGGMAANK